MSTECRLSRRTVRALVPAGTCRACVLYFRQRPFIRARNPMGKCERCGIDRLEVLLRIIAWCNERTMRGLEPEPTETDPLRGHADPGAFAMAELERMREPA